MLREGAIAFANPKHGPDITVAASGSATPTALAAADGDLTDHPASDPRRVDRRRVLDDTDEFVTWDTGESCVSLQQFEIGAADACGGDAYEAFISCPGRGPAAKSECAVRVEDECPHEG